jgi:hypothetical protein
MPTAPMAELPHRPGFVRKHPRGNSHGAPQSGERARPRSPNLKLGAGISALSDSSGPVRLFRFLCLCDARWTHGTPTNRVNPSAGHAVGRGSTVSVGLVANLISESRTACGQPVTSTFVTLRSHFSLEQRVPSRSGASISCRRVGTDINRLASTPAASRSRHRIRILPTSTLR